MVPMAPTKQKITNPIPITITASSEPATTIPSQSKTATAAITYMR